MTSRTERTSARAVPDGSVLGAWNEERSARNVDGLQE
jgi:hypothetical protein